MASISEEIQREDALLCARLEDAARLCDRRSCPCFVGFLDERQRGIAQVALRQMPEADLCFYGGYPEAERTLAGLFPSFMEPDETLFPLTALAFTYRETAEVTHRDVLGTILSCGIKRDKVGDILCAPGLAVAFVNEELAAYLSEQITKVRGEGVSLLFPYVGDLPDAHTFREISGTVASSRLDAVLKVALGVSREEAARRIVAGQVALNHAPVLSVSAAVQEGDLLSIRGEGRFRIRTLGPLTRKGRLNISVQQYI